MRLSGPKPTYDWYNWHRPDNSDKSGRVTFISIASDDIKSRSEDAMNKDLYRSGLIAEYIKSTPNASQNPYGDTTGECSYLIPYYDLQGKFILDQSGYPRMYRRRRFLPDTADPKDKKRKYLGPSQSQVGDLSNIPYLHPDVWKLEGNRLAITEGEKKAAAVNALLKIPCIGIGGCQNWRAGAGDNHLHPWIRHVLDVRKPEVVVVIPDGDYRKYHIQTAYGGMITQILDRGIRVEVRVPHRDKKIDDHIVTWDKPEQFELLEPEPTDSAGRPHVVEPAARLIELFGLVTIARGGGRTPERLEIVSNAANAHILVSQHPAFREQFWYNQDNNAIMNGDVPLMDSDPNEVLGYIQHNLSIPKASRIDVAEAIRQTAEHDQRSPHNNWLRGLKWDKKERLERWLIDYVGAEDTPLVREASVKFLVGAVKRRLEPGCKMDWMLITHGAQGIGKSSLPAILFGPDDVVPMMHTDDGKDFKALFHRGWCVNFEELEVMGKRDIEGLKAIISSPVDVFRPPYGRSERSMKRRCVLYGSTNSPHFLPADPSGYRRYVVVEMRQCLFKKLEADREQLWAEAMHRYNIGGTDPSQVLAVSTSDVASYVIENEMHTEVVEILRKRINLKVSKNYDGEFYAFKFADVLRGAGYSDRDIANPNVTKSISAKLYGLGWRRVSHTTAGIVKPYVIKSSEWSFDEEVKDAKY